MNRPSGTVDWKEGEESTNLNCRLKFGGYKIAAGRSTGSDMHVVFKEWLVCPSEAAGDARKETGATSCDACGHFKTAGFYSLPAG